MRSPRCPSLSALSSPVRHLLSGKSDSDPDYVEDLALPGDAGLFGPTSVVWRVHADVSMLVGGVRALVLQTLDPLALAGVLQHSRFRDDPLGRLQTTTRFVTLVTFADSSVVARECDAVRRVHERVTGTLADGRRYAASDPLRLRYVHLSLVDSFLSAYQLFSGDPLRSSEADRYVVEMNRLAPLLGFEAVVLPSTVAELRHMLLPREADLAVSPSTLEVLDFLGRPPLPSAQQVAYGVLHRAAVASLSREVRSLLPRAPQGFAVAARIAEAWPLVILLRAALGPSPSLSYASQRLSG